MADLSFVAHEAQADCESWPRVIVLVATSLLIIAGLIYAMHGSGWLPVVLLPVIGAGGASLVRLLTRSRLEASGFLVLIACHSLFAAIFNVINLQGFGKLFEEGDSQGYYDFAVGVYGPVQLNPLGIVYNGRRLQDSTLSVVIYQKVLDFTRFLGAPDAAWQLLMTNAALLALALVFVLRSARICFPNSARAIVAAGAVFATSPLLLLYAVEPLRDSFGVAMTACLLYTAVRLAARPSWMRTIVFATTAGLFFYLITFLRLQFLFIAPMVALIVLVTAAFYGRRTPGRTLLLAGGLAAFVAILIGVLPNLIDTITLIQYYSETYSNQAVEHGEGQGLGYLLVVSLPLPLRVLVGSITMHINPIPLWAYLDLAGMPARLLYSLNGIWAVLLVPPAVTGISLLFSKARAAALDKPALMIAALGYVGTLLAVSMTSMEIRHLSAFYPAFCLIAAAPFAVGRAVWPRLRSTSQAWLGAVVLIHMAWAILKAVM